MLPTFGEYISVEFIYWYWIYPANYWGICVSWRVCAPGPNCPGPNCPPWKKWTVGPRTVWPGSNVKILLTYVLKILAARRAHRNTPTDIYYPNVGSIYPMQIYILPNVHSWAHRNPLTDTFPPIVGMIYPIPIYKYNWHVFLKSEYKYKWAQGL